VTGVSDRTERKLERRASGGDVEAAAERIRLRHRRGDLPEERLRLAAHLGDAAAVIAARDVLNVAPRKQGVGAWIRAIGKPNLKTWPEGVPWVPLVQPVCVRIAIAAAELGLSVWATPAWSEEVDAQDADTQLLASALAQAKTWLGDPRREVADTLWNDLASARLSGVPVEVAIELASVVCQPVSLSARSPHARERDVARSAAQVAEAAARALAWKRAKREADETLRAGIREAVIPWLLK
jgi:hypothetical protein